MGKSKKQTIGYKYFLGMHLILAQQLLCELQPHQAVSVSYTGDAAPAPDAVASPVVPARTVAARYARVSCPGQSFYAPPLTLI